MILTGLVMLVFVVLHLGRSSTARITPRRCPVSATSIRLLVEVFQNPFYVGFYVVCMGLVGLHLRHGISSAFQSLGLMPTHVGGPHPPRRRGLAVVVAGLFALIPVYVFLFL